MYKLLVCTLLVVFLTGCGEQKLSPEFEYRSDNVRRIRVRLKLPEGDIPADHINERVNELIVATD